MRHQMSWNGKDERKLSVQERGFSLEVDGRTVPGVYWSPAEGSSDRLVLLGHGGTTHKKVEYIEQVAKLLVGRGISAMAIDGPGHGERASVQAGREPTDVVGLDAFPRMWHEGGGTAAVIADWAAALDFIEAEEGPRPTGWWGLSMGTMMGLPVTASDKRIKVALLGLMGVEGVNGEDLVRLAPQVTCPVRYLLQWDDELVSLQSGLELFGKLGTKQKTLHVNPGKHSAVPTWEMFAGTVDYLDQRLK
uniref:Esterase n=2 Tax=unclassified sequences TaxID=12908 RepID=J7FSB6_9ZZZZ|nr:esterase [uncultured microorganism]